MVNRKKFVQLASMGLGTFMLPNFLFSQLVDPSQTLIDEQTTDPNKALAALALTAARSKGASYADVRIGSYPPANIGSGMGVRVLVDGVWGFAATNVMTDEAITECAAKAVTMATEKGASSPVQRHQYQVKYRHELWMSDCFRK